MNPVVVGVCGRDACLLVVCKERDEERGLEKRVPFQVSSLSPLQTSSSAKDQAFSLHLLDMFHIQTTMFPFSLFLGPGTSMPSLT